MSRGARLQKAVEWQARLARFEQTDATVAEFCDDEGVSVASFYQWRRKLSRSVTAKPQIGDDDRGEEAGSDGRFAPVRLVGTSSLASQTMIAELPGGIRLEIPVGDPRLLQVAIAAFLAGDAARTGAAAC